MMSSSIFLCRSISGQVQHYYALLVVYVGPLRHVHCTMCDGIRTIPGVATMLLAIHPMQQECNSRSRCFIPKNMLNTTCIEHSYESLQTQASCCPCGLYSSVCVPWSLMGCCICSHAYPLALCVVDPLQEG